MSRKKRISDTLNTALHPTLLIVENESNQHRVPEGSESHFKVTAVAELFKTHTRISRHRWINTLLAAEFDTGLHALSLQLYTPEAWAIRNQTVLPSPACRGGSHHG